MVIQNYRDIKVRAKKTLSYTPWDIKKLALVFGLVSLGVGPLLIGVDVLLLKAMENAQGLSGLGLPVCLKRSRPCFPMHGWCFRCYGVPVFYIAVLCFCVSKTPGPRDFSVALKNGPAC